MQCNNIILYCHRYLRDLKSFNMFIKKIVIATNGIIIKKENHTNNSRYQVNKLYITYNNYA